MEHTLPYNIVVEWDINTGSIYSRLSQDKHCTRVQADVIESFILAQVMAGIDITTREYSDSIKTLLDSLANNS